MRLEMHAHDCEVSPCAVIKAKELVDGYKEAGYDGIVITNHFDKGIMHMWGETTEEHYQTYLRGYELAKEEGERVGLSSMFPGFPGNSGILCIWLWYPLSLWSVQTENRRRLSDRSTG